MVSLLSFLKPFVEIAIIWFILYIIILFIRGTRAVQVLAGMGVLILASFLAQRLGLDAINWVLTKVFAFGAVAFLILFQPELRKGLARIGQRQFFWERTQASRTVDAVVKAVGELSRKKIGALIALERTIGLRSFAEDAIPLDAAVTQELLETIFMPNTPLHDGGVVIQEERVAACGCLFPLTQSESVLSTLGTRHRAALGLAEETDAICVVVSEETGTLSVAVDGRLMRDLDPAKVRELLNQFYRPTREVKKGIRPLGAASA
ncbi:MAG: TIGR00159 family protein [Candidatus Omnitrophica bacterium]|nr:TIGR00159 family protein [Candidatus Omnitrophota bacterium]